jgi:hypothetical protein
MRKLFVSFAIACSFLAPTVFAANIDPSTVDFPWMNGPARDSRYKLADFPNKVHVFEAFALSCSWCNRNAEQVKALAAEYAEDDRVQFIDLGLDSDDRNIARWITTHAPTYPVVKDVGRTVWTALQQANGIPQTFVVACDGTMTDHTIGYWDSAAKTKLRNAIAAAKETTCE